MDWFARLGYEHLVRGLRGLYGRSDKWRPVNADVSCGADDLEAASDYVLKETKQKLLLYGASSGALRAACSRQRHPERVQRAALDALVWTGEGTPTLAERPQAPAAVPREQPQADRPRFSSQQSSRATNPGTSDL